MGTTNVNITLPLKDSVAHDITHLRETIVAGQTTIVNSIDNVTSSITFADMTYIAIGVNVHFPDTGELATVTAMPGTPGGPTIVTRGNTGDTAINNFPEAAAASHPAGASVHILKFAGLADMGEANALAIMQQDIQQMGTNSETIGTILNQQTTDTANLQNALNNLVNE